MAAISACMIKPVAFKAVSVKSTSGKATKSVFVSNATIKKTSANMKVWTPLNNKFFETFSFLPPLTKDDIIKQIDYMVRNGWTPCLEFANPEDAYIADTNTVRIQNGCASNYYDNRYWTMWKLPMFGCTDGSQVIGEITNCTKAFPDAYVRVVAFDASRQVQVAGFLVHRPPSAKDFQAPLARSV